MGLFEQLPYTNFHELNLTEMIKYLDSLQKEIKDFTAVNKIHNFGAWDINKSYPIYSIVSNNDRGYISLKPVPAGISIDNIEYWEIIADYTSLYAELGNIITELRTRVNAIEPIVIDNNQRLVTNQINIAKYCVWIGDSYTSAGSLGDSVDKRFSTIVSKTIGLTEKNYAVGGTGYYHGGTTYQTQVANAILDFKNKNLDVNAVKYVFIVGNRNDADDNLNYNEYATPVRNTIDAAHSAFPKAKIVIIPGLWDWKCAPQYLLRLTQIIYQTAQLYTYTYIVNGAWQWLTGFASYILWQNGADVHPDVNGHAIIANHILNALNGTNYPPVYEYEFVPTSTHANVSNCKMYIQIANGRVDFRCRFKVSANPTSGEIFRFTFNSLNINGLFMMNNSDGLYITAMSNSGTQTRRPAVHIVQNTTKTDTQTGSMYINAYCYDGGNNWATGDSMNEIVFSIPYGVRFALY